MGDTLNGSHLNALRLNSALEELVFQLTLIDKPQLEALLKQFGVEVKDLSVLNTELKSIDSNFELIEFDDANFPLTQVAILPHGSEHDIDSLMFVAEAANRPDLLETED